MEAAGVIVRVVKNRLVRKALRDLQLLEDDQFNFKGMLVYIFNPFDEVRGAQIIKAFVKNSAAPLNFIGAITETGQLMSREDVIRLSGLASKPDLIGQMISSLQAPLNQMRMTLNNQLSNMLINIKESKI